MTKSPARIHVLLARDARTGVVIRRGPSKHVAVIGWNLSTDRFELGQWLLGRIYERRSDLSPDGKHFIYFAMNGKWDLEAEGAWTAISRAHYLKALALYPKGDCWNGGGLWTSNSTYWVNGGSTYFESTEVKRDHQFKPQRNYGSECTGVYYLRLIRDGWVLMDQIRDSKSHRIDLFRKNVDNTWQLQKFAHAGVHRQAGKGCYWDEHALLRRATGEVISKPDWEWAELDGERIVWASRGCLWQGNLGNSDIVEEKLLFDFNPMKFRPIPAPY